MSWTWALSYYACGLKLLMGFGLKLSMYAVLKHLYIGVFWWMSWTSHFIFQPSARLSALLAQVLVYEALSY
jgi:hypothetical protein